MGLLTDDELKQLYSAYTDAINAVDALIRLHGAASFLGAQVESNPENNSFVLMQFSDILDSSLRAVECMSAVVALTGTSERESQQFPHWFIRSIDERTVSVVPYFSRASTLECVQDLRDFLSISSLSNDQELQEALTAATIRPYQELPNKSDSMLPTAVAALGGVIFREFHLDPIRVELPILSNSDAMIDFGQKVKKAFQSEALSEIDLFKVKAMLQIEFGYVRRDNPEMSRDFNSAFVSIRHQRVDDQLSKFQLSLDRTRGALTHANFSHETPLTSSGVNALETILLEEDPPRENEAITDRFRSEVSNLRDTLKTFGLTISDARGGRKYKIVNV